MWALRQIYHIQVSLCVVTMPNHGGFRSFSNFHKWRENRKKKTNQKPLKNTWNTNLCIEQYSNQNLMSIFTFADHKLIRLSELKKLSVKYCKTCEFPVHIQQRSYQWRQFSYTWPISIWAKYKKACIWEVTFKSYSAMSLKGVNWDFQNPGTYTTYTCTTCSILLFCSLNTE